MALCVIEPWKAADVLVYTKDLYVIFYWTTKGYQQVVSLPVIAAYRE